VEAVLRQLDIAPEESGRFIEVWNKVDILPPGHRKNGNGNPPASGIQTIAVSALTGEGMDTLLAAIEARVIPDHEDYRVTLSGAELGNLHRLYDLAEVLERTSLESGDIEAVARVPRASINRFLKLFPHATGTKRD
jgi:GTP-binding protein HflX